MNTLPLVLDIYYFPGYDPSTSLTDIAGIPTTSSTNTGLTMVGANPSFFILPGYSDEALLCCVKVVGDPLIINTNTANPVTAMRVPLDLQTSCGILVGGHPIHAPH